MFMKLKKATTAPPRTVGADPRVCPNNKEQPACPCTPNSRADTGVCPYRWSQRHSSLFSPFLPFKPFMPLGSGACGTSVK